MQSRSEEHTSELQSHRDLHSFPTRRSSDLIVGPTLDEKNYNLVIAQLIFLQQQDPSQEISLWINSDHPSEISALAICDVIASLPCDVRTYCVGKGCNQDRKSTRLNSSHTEIYTLSLHDALPI